MKLSKKKLATRRQTFGVDIIKCYLVVRDARLGLRDRIPVSKGEYTRKFSNISYSPMVGFNDLASKLS